MKISSVETTPNPNSIKLNFVEPLGQTATYTSSSQAAPDFVIKLLAIEGVQSVFVCGDFITLNRHPLSDWRLLLELATFALTGDKLSGLDSSSSSSSSSSSVTVLDGQSQIFVQTFRGVPIQVKAVDLLGETRLSLGSAFNEAAQLIQKETGADFLKERLWQDHGLRYGERAEVAEQVLSELQNYFSPERLGLLVRQALGASGAEPEADLDHIKRLLSHSQWQQRLLAVQELSRIDSSQSVVIDLLIESLQDSNAQVRRLAAAALGTTGSAMAVPSLCQAVTCDSSIAVRRTAGDALSDIGDPAAHPAMCLALLDGNKLVRWRAARFLNDLGGEESLPYLEAALNDSEYEVFLEIGAAIERIRSGALGAGPAWKRIADR
jgi:HEAT repeat protein